MILVRKASLSDVSLIVSYIDKKAAYDFQRGYFDGTLGASVERIGRALFGVPVFAHALLVTSGKKPVGFAFYHYRFSACEGRPSLWLDSLYVDEEAGRCGAGLALMQTLGREAGSRDCMHLAWTTDERNEIGCSFFKKIGANVDSWRDHTLLYSITPDLLRIRGADEGRSRNSTPPQVPVPVESPTKDTPPATPATPATPVEFGVPKRRTAYKTLVAADIYRDGGSIEVRLACTDGSFETLWLQASLDHEFGMRYIHTEFLIFADADRQGPSYRILKGSPEEEAVLAALGKFLRNPRVAVPFSHRTPDQFYLEKVEALIPAVRHRIPAAPGTVPPV